MYNCRSHFNLQY